METYRESQIQKRIHLAVAAPFLARLSTRYFEFIGNVARDARRSSIEGLAYVPERWQLLEGDMTYDLTRKLGSVKDPAEQRVLAARFVMRFVDS